MLTVEMTTGLDVNCEILIGILDEARAWRKNDMHDMLSSPHQFVLETVSSMTFSEHLLTSNSP